MTKQLDKVMPRDDAKLREEMTRELETLLIYAFEQPELLYSLGEILLRLGATPRNYNIKRARCAR